MACSGVLATALAALGALAWSGCSVQARGGGDAYCDNTGCYQCDGYSCTPIPGTGPGETSGGTSSSSGSQATVDSGLVTTTSDAGTGAVGDASHADAAPAPPPDCVTTDDCKAAVPQACIGGYCRYTCSSNLQCAEIDARLGVCSAADAGNGYCVSGAE